MGVFACAGHKDFQQIVMVKKINSDRFCGAKKIQ